ncbi:MAG: DUF1835 domain-containing protein [Bacteroidota bacterium]
MSDLYHILNGDALLEQFPTQILGTRIVARECLVDGPVGGSDLTDFFQQRDAFLRPWDQEAEGLLGAAQIYHEIQQIPADSEIHLWFEEDLFCQVNLWFVLSCLQARALPFTLYLILPHADMRYGFGGLSQEELIQAWERRQKLEKTGGEALAQLWPAYQKGQTTHLHRLAEALSDSFPFVLPAVEAHIARIPTETHPGRPIATLKAIMAELQTDQFGPVFREFVHREPIYGFGDLQVHKMWQDIRQHP